MNKTHQDLKRETKKENTVWEISQDEKSRWMNRNYKGKHHQQIQRMEERISDTEYMMKRHKYIDKKLNLTFSDMKYPGNLGKYENTNLRDKRNAIKF